MEIIVRRDDLVRELQIAQGIVERKGSIPILSSVLLDARDGRLHVAATDLDLSLRTSCEAQVVEDGALVLHGKRLYDVARALPEGDVHLTEMPNAWARVEAGRYDLKVGGEKREEFPALPELANARDLVQIAAGVLRELIARTSFAMTGENARYYLSGALMVIEREAVVMVATDGHRLAYVRHRADTEVKKEARATIPARAIHELKKLAEAEGVEHVGFGRGAGHLIFTAGERTLASKMIDGQFPAHEKVIVIEPQDMVRAVVGRDALASAVRRVALVGTERSRAIKLTFSPDELALDASSPEGGEAHETVSCEFQGEQPLAIGFNATYIADFLAAAGTSSVEIDLRKETAGVAIWRPAAEERMDYRCALAPLRI